MTINTVTVVGASGNMGAYVSGIFASFGRATVFMVSRSKNAKMVDRAVSSVRCDSIRPRLIPMDYSELAECVSKSDLVFESVAEDFDTKASVNSIVAANLNPKTIMVTGSSGLSLTKLASLLPSDARQRYFGMHMFSPPYSMPLCEVVRTSYVSECLISDTCRYLKSKLFRSVVIVKDSPAFLANRIGFQFINRALQYAEKYKDRGGVDYVDAILGTFTGRAMTPCRTADFVGLDVHKPIVDNLFQNTNDDFHESFVLPEYVDALIEKGLLGRKTGGGLFKQDNLANGTKRSFVYDIEQESFREMRNYTFDFAVSMKKHLHEGDYGLAFAALLESDSEEARICMEFLKGYVDYSVFVAKEVCERIEDVDDAMAQGFNWCPPLALSNMLFGTNYNTKYDYRSFFKVGE